MIGGVGGVVTSFDEAVSWEIDPEDARLRMTDRVVVRLPELVRRVWRRMESEPAGSPLRRKFASRVLRAGWAATDRRDWKYVARLYDPNVEVHWGNSFIDVPDYMRGWAALQKALESVYEAFETTEQSPREAIDFGGPFFAARLGTDLTGQGSGISLQEESFALYEVGDGVCVRQWYSPEQEEIEAWLSERAAELG